MTPDALLDKLEALEKIDSKIIAKLRRQAQKPEKEITVKKILSFLVKNDHLTKDEAIDIRRELKVETKVKQAKGRNTDDLVAGVLEPVEPEAVELDEQVEDILDSPTEVAEISKSKKRSKSKKNRVADSPLEAVPVQQYDPLADPMASTWESSLPESSGVARPQSGFAGKMDSSDQWATKWIFIGFGILGLLLVVGTLLTFVLSMISAVDRFEAAMKSYEDGTYGDAIKKFDEFLEKHSSHEKAPIARVTRVQALLADTFKQRNWDETIVRAEKHLPPLIDDDTIDLEKIRQELALILPNTTLAMAKRANKQDSKSALIEQLGKAKNAKTLVDNPVYIPNSKRKQASVADTLEKIDEEIAKGDILIKKQNDFEAALSEITQLRDQGQTDQAFSVYNNLIRSYGDLRSNEQLQTEMKQVSQQEAQLVRSVDAAFTSANDFRNSPIESSVVLTSKSGSPIESLKGETLPVLADGSVYGVDVGDGSVRWRRFVGYQTDIQPIKTDSDTVLISDQSNNDLILVNSVDGQLVWRSEINEPFLRPQLEENIIYLTTESGKLIRLNPADGSVAASVKIPQKASVPMTRFGRQQLVLQPGNYSNLYILAEDTLECQDVIYLGHQPGSIFAAPVVWKNYVLICVNVSGACDLYVLRPNPETKKMELVQRLRPVTRGLVNRAPTRFGRFMVINSEEGDLKILQIDSSNETSPVSILDAETFDNQSNARIYLATAGSQLWVASRGIMRYKVSRSQGSFERQKIANSEDTFVGPLHKIGDSIIHVRKRYGSSLTSVSAVDGTSLQQIWRTDLGGPLAGTPIMANGQIAAVSSQGDLFTFADNADQDQFVSDEVKSSNIVQNLLFDETIELSPGVSVCVGPIERPDIIYVDANNRTSKLLRLPQPADKPASRPIRIDTDLIVPSKQGQVVRINPATARIVGTPFLPPVSPGTNMDWKRPTALDGNRFVIGANNSLYLIDASDRKVLSKAGQLDISEVVNSPLAAVGDTVFGVFQTGKAEKLMSFTVSGDNISAANSVDLSGLVSAGPWSVNNQILVRLSDNNLVSFDSGLNQKWSTKLPADALVAAPDAEGNRIRLFFGSGKLIHVAADSGNLESEFSIGQPIVHKPIMTGGKMLFAGSDGTVHKVSAPQ